MSALIRGLTYNFHRNIGWQDRAFRTGVAITASIGASYFFKTSPLYTSIFISLAAAPFFTVAMARCIICFFIGRCTIGPAEKRSLESKGMQFEK